MAAETSNMIMSIALPNGKRFQYEIKGDVHIDTDNPNWLEEMIQLYSTRMAYGLKKLIDEVET